jgi:hypothetical protein
MLSGWNPLFQELSHPNYPPRLQLPLSHPFGSSPRSVYLTWLAYSLIKTVSPSQEEVGEGEEAGDSEENTTDKVRRLEE